MAEFLPIRAAQAPARPIGRGSPRVRMLEYEGYVRTLRSGRARKLTPSEGETVAGIAGG